MSMHFRKYDHENDFLMVRDFIVRIHGKENLYYNWTIERWNYAFHAVINIMETSEEEWFKRVGIWEDEKGEIKAVITAEGEDRGEAHFIIDPDYTELAPLEEMFDFIERNHVCDVNGKQILRARITKGDEKKEYIAKNRGYAPFLEEGFQENNSYISLNQEFDYALPEGFTVKSMADNNDIERRTLAFAKAFGNYGTENEVKSHVYEELQKAPDYRKEFDIYVEAPNGDFASVALVWFDEKNKIAALEHVGTDPKYRRMGLAKAANYEAIKRVKALGAKVVYVGSDQEFYKSIGFEIKYYVHIWQKEY